MKGCYMDNKDKRFGFHSKVRVPDMEDIRRAAGDFSEKPEQEEVRNAASRFAKAPPADAFTAPKYETKFSSMKTEMEKLADAVAREEEEKLAAAGASCKTDEQTEVSPFPRTGDVLPEENKNFTEPQNHAEEI